MSQNKAWEREVTPAGKHEYLNIGRVWHLWRRHIVCIHSVHYLEMIQCTDKHSRWYKLSYGTWTSPKVLLAWMRGWARLNSMLVTFSTLLGTYITNLKGAVQEIFYTSLFLESTPKLVSGFFSNSVSNLRVYLLLSRDSLYHSSQSRISLRGLEAPMNL
jgi:hypothetical protein